ncbi:MAG: MFS transporter [Fervidobacterium sp.]
MISFSKLKGTFHLYHVISFFISINAYLFSTFLNSTAAKLEFTFFEIGLLNLFASIIYALSSVTLGSYGHKTGYKKTMMILFFYLLGVSFFGFSITDKISLYTFGALQGAFFGAFFPQVEGLIAKSESTLDIDPPSITGRFTLSWSSGNIIGVAFGPYLTIKAAPVIFLYGIILSTILIFVIIRDIRSGDTIKFNPKASLLLHLENSAVVKNKMRMRIYRLEYRIILFLGGLIYTSVLAHFPKLLNLSKIDISHAGFLTVGANIGVLITFLVLQYWKSWVGNELISAALLSVVPLTGISVLLSKIPVMFFLTAFLAGCSYAVPYTLAIFYGLLSAQEEHGKQGALHEMVIGLLFGVGPFVGGVFLDWFKNTIGLAILSFLLSVFIYFVQIIFNLRKLRVEKS